jgi:ubiquitin carboxyl-terminal hydrolase 8
MSTLEQMLAKDTSVEPIERNCERCGSKDATTRVRYARLPDRLQVQIGRHASDGREAKKLRQTVRFPIRGLDMEPYHIPPEERFIDESDAKVAEAARDRGFRAPFIYDCYAVICHIGEQIRSGHYVCYVRDQRSDDATDWIKFNDTRYNEIKVGTNDARDRTEEIYAVQKDNQQAYLVLYQRRGA